MAKEITAVEWLVKKIKKDLSIHIPFKRWLEIKDLISYAKDYERSQISNVYDLGQMDMAKKKIQLGSEFYKKKYGKKTNNSSTPI